MAGSPIGDHNIMRSQCRPANHVPETARPSHRATLGRTPPCRSISLPSTRDWHRQRLVGVEAIDPNLHGLLVDHAAGIDIVQRFERQTPEFFFLLDPGGQGSTGPLERSCAYFPKALATARCVITPTRWAR